MLIPEFMDVLNIHFKFVRDRTNIAFILKSDR